jgi:hypothetical protein
MGMTMTSHEGTCKACGRFQGAVLTCPYCGWVADDAALRRRLRLVAVGLALCGLALLYAMARLRPSEQVAIGSIGPRMQYASVRVCGTVTRKPYVSRHSNGVDYVSLLINDGSGSLRAMARGPVAGAIVAGDRLPRKGEEVEVGGRLSVSADGARNLRILRPDALVCRPRPDRVTPREPG